MKRVFSVLILAFAVSGLVMAEGIELGTFPLGSWKDANYEAVWEFSSGNVRILSPAGEVYYDFGKATVEGLKVGLEGGMVTLSFSCSETGKSYKFTKPLTEAGLILEIDRPAQPHYKVSMPKQ
jgi:hypothetical protein